MAGPAGVWFVGRFPKSENKAAVANTTAAFVVMICYDMEEFADTVIERSSSGRTL